MSAHLHGPRSPRPWYLKWQFPTPAAATAELWSRWERYMRAKHPIVAFFQLNVPRFFGRYKFRLQESYWAVRHRTINRFDIVKLRSLSPGYHDVDTQILAACFDLLCVYVENKVEMKGLDKIEALMAKLDEWFIETQEDYYPEMAALYWWWMVERKQRIIPTMEVPDYVFSNTEGFYNEQDDGMLMRLMRIRGSLW